jgi:hypothetical protein
MRTHRVAWAALPAAAGVILLFGANPSVLAQTSVDRSFEPAPKDCADVRWSQRALDAFPSIADACQAVEERNGITYVKFEGVVEDVKNGGKQVRVDLEGTDELTFRPTPRTKLYIDGQRTEFADLEDGTKLNFYIPEDRLEAHIQPNPERVAFAIFPNRDPRRVLGGIATSDGGVTAHRWISADDRSGGRAAHRTRLRGAHRTHTQ